MGRQGFDKEKNIAHNMYVNQGKTPEQIQQFLTKEPGLRCPVQRTINNWISAGLWREAKMKKLEKDEPILDSREKALQIVRNAIRDAEQNTCKDTIGAYKTAVDMAAKISGIVFNDLEKVYWRFTEDFSDYLRQNAPDLAEAFIPHLLPFWEAYKEKYTRWEKELNQLTEGVNVK